MDADELYKKAYGAVERGNPDYAIELFLQILDFFPDHVQARKSLRATEIRKADEAGLNGFKRFLEFVKGIDVALKILMLKRSSKHDKTMTECERYLVSDPKAAWVLKILGDAALKAGHQGAAQVAYENILTADKGNAAALFSLAGLCEEQDDFDQAHKYLARLKSVKPNDRTVEKRIRDLGAKSTLQAGQWDKTETDFKDKLKDKKSSQRLEDQQRIIRTTEDVDNAIERLQADLESNPKDNRLLRELGDMYRRRRAFQKAFETYQRCLQNDANDFAAKARIGDMHIQQFDEKIEKLETRLKEGPEDAAGKAEMTELKKKRLAFSIQEYRRRAKDMPTDATLKFKLGKFLRQGGILDEAIANFQAAVSDSKLKTDAHIEMGLCFNKKEQSEMAERQFVLANNELQGMNRKKMDVMYELALVQKAAGKTEEARAALAEIYEVDINFKDVGELLQSLNEAKPPA